MHYMALHNYGESEDEGQFREDIMRAGEMLRPCCCKSAFLP